MKALKKPRWVRETTLFFILIKDVMNISNNTPGKSGMTCQEAEIVPREMTELPVRFAIKPSNSESGNIS